MADPFAHLGRNLLVPFRRDGAQDFANGTGLDVVRSSIRTILGTLNAGPNTGGEVPFNQDLGTQLPTLRHSNINDPRTHNMAVFYVVEAIKKNEPRVLVREVNISKRPDTRRIVIRLRYDVVDVDLPASAVIARDVNQEVIV
jgi:phage baseplate assembly protein W